MEMFRLMIGPDDGATTLQLCVRAIVIFAAGIVFIRVAGRRTFSQYSPLDIVVSIIVGSNLSRIMTGRAAFFSGFAATFALVLLHRVVAMAAMHWPSLGRLIKGRPVKLIQDGVIDDRRLKIHGLSRDDLIEALRLEKIDDPQAVTSATLEGGGKISVVKKD